MRCAVRNTPQDGDLYAASGAVGPGAPEGTAEMVGRLRKVRGGTGEPSDGRRGGVWVVHQRRRRKAARQATSGPTAHVVRSIAGGVVVVKERVDHGSTLNMACATVPL